MIKSKLQEKVHILLEELLELFARPQVLKIPTNVSSKQFKWQESFSCAHVICFFNTYDLQ